MKTKDKDVRRHKILNKTANKSESLCFEYIFK